MEAYAWTLWVAIAIFALIAEVNTTALISIWFVPAALISALISVFVGNFAIQLIVFIILSGIFLYVFRNVYKKHIKKSQEGETDLVLNKVGTAVEETSSIGGKVLIGDIYWKARAENNIPAGTKVKVIDHSGTTLTVEPIE